MKQAFHGTRRPGGLNKKGAGLPPVGTGYDPGGGGLVHGGRCATGFARHTST